MEELCNASEETMVLYNDTALFPQLVALMEGEEPALSDTTHPLIYHLTLIRLLQLCTDGKNGDTELKAANLLTVEDIVRVVTHPSATLLVKKDYLSFLFHCYIETDVEIVKDAILLSKLKSVFFTLVKDIDNLANNEVINFEEHRTYVKDGIVQLLNHFFTKFQDDEATVPFEALQPQQYALSELVRALRQVKLCVRWTSKEISQIDGCTAVLLKVASRRGIILTVGDEQPAPTKNFRPFAKNVTNLNAFFFSSTMGGISSQRTASLRSSKSTDFRSIVDRLSEVTSVLEPELRSFMDAEFSVLVDILHKPHVLFLADSIQDSKCRSGAFVTKMINHCKALSRDVQKQEDNLCIRLLQTLRKMVHKDDFTDERAARIRILIYNRYLSEPFQLQPPGTGDVSTWQLEDIQSRMDNSGATALVVDLIMSNPATKVFHECVSLAIALLEDGNTQVQTTFLTRLQKDGSSEKFFAVLAEKFGAAKNKLSSASPMATDLIISGDGATGSGAGSNAPSSAGRRSPRASVTPTRKSSNASGSNLPVGGSKASRKQSHCVSSTDSAQPNADNATSPETTTLQPAMPSTSDVMASVASQLLCTPLLVGNAAAQTGQSGLSQSLSIIGSLQARGDGDSGQSPPTPQPGAVPGVAGGEDPSTQPLTLAPSAYDTGGHGGWSLTNEVRLIDPILRFLQLLCENHNRDLQTFLRCQGTKNDTDMIILTLSFLDALCGSTTGSLGFLGWYINKYNVGLVNQTLISLTEYCQGPCHENQNAIAAHEANGLDMVISLVLNKIRPLADLHQDLAMEVKSNASKLLLAIMESRHDCENADRITSNMNRMPDGAAQLISAITQAYNTDTNTNNESMCGDECRSRDVGHNIYILAHQLAEHNKEVAALMDEPTRALEYYKKHTAEIEIVREEGVMERIVFPVPSICNYLTDETRLKVFHDTERDEQGSKVSHFVSQVDELHKEMIWQKELREQRFLNWAASRLRAWSFFSYSSAIYINFLIACYFPFDGVDEETPNLQTTFFYLASIFGLLTFFLPKRDAGLLTLFYCMVRFLLMIGVKPTLFLLGVFQLANKALHVISYMGNHGTFQRNKFEILEDQELMLILVYMAFCVLGLIMHPLFYSVLLLDLVAREETLQNVIRSVTRNWRSIALTAVLATTEVYLFAIFGYLMFSADYVQERDPPPAELLLLQASAARPSSFFWGIFSRSSGSALNETLNGTCSANSTLGCGNFTSLEISDDDDAEAKLLVCHDLWGCLIETINCGLRSGGGIGDCLRKRAPDENFYMARVVFDICFFFIVITITLNLIFGVIIDTFADLRTEKQEKDEILRNTCFVCSLNRGAFDNKSTSFEEHIQKEHNVWKYLNFIILLRVKSQTEFTGPESYVDDLLQAGSLDWFPRMRAMSLSLEGATDGSEQTDIRSLHGVLKQALDKVGTLSNQLNSLRKQMNQQQNRRHRNEILHHTSLGRAGNATTSNGS